MNCEDEWTGVCIDSSGTGCVIRTEQLGAIVWNVETDDEEVYNVEYCHAPQDLLSGRGKGLLGLFCLCCCQTDQLRATESYCLDNGQYDDIIGSFPTYRIHEYRAEPFKPVCKGARITPIPSTNVSLRTSGDAASVDDDPQNDQPYTGYYLDYRKNELNCRKSVSSHVPLFKGSLSMTDPRRNRVLQTLE